MRNGKYENVSLFPPKLDQADDDLDDLVDDNEGEPRSLWGHSTPAHKLLMCPCIKKLPYPKEFDEHYVMKLEKECGQIGVYGQGENSNTADDSQNCPHPLLNGISNWRTQVQENSGGDGESKSQSTSTLFVLDGDSEVDDFDLLMANSESVRRYHKLELLFGYVIQWTYCLYMDIVRLLYRRLDGRFCYSSALCS